MKVTRRMMGLALAAVTAVGLSQPTFAASTSQSLGAESVERDADVQGVKSSNGSSSRSEVPRRKMDQDNISLPPLSQNNGSDSDSDDDADLFG